MPSPVTPTIVCATVPASTGTVCEKLESLFRLSQVMCDFFSWAVQDDGEPTAEFIAWLNALAVPTGTVIWRPVAVVPSGFLHANGQLVNRTTYASLFAVYGTAFGAGDGSTTFGLPNMNGRLAIGTGTSTADGAVNRNVGETGGAEQITQDESEMPAHVHGLPVGMMSFGIASGQKGTEGGNAFRYTDPPDTESTGGGQPMNIMNPTMAGLWLVKY